MSIIAYIYTDPIIDPMPDSLMWGLEIDQVYHDIGDRKALETLLLNCQKNSPNYCLVYSLDQFGDSLTDVINIISKIEDLAIEIIAIEQDYNSSKFKVVSDNLKKKELSIIWQEVEKKLVSRKLQKSHANNRFNNLPPPGKAPYGYLKGKDSYIINRGTAPIVKAFFERFLFYGSLRDSVRYLAEKYNKKISLSTAKYWLKNPVYRGDLVYKNKDIISDTHTAIITREEAAQIDRILKSHSLVKPRSASTSHSLAGLVKCQKCESSFKITKVTNRQKQQFYLYLTPNKCLLNYKCKSLKYQEVFEQTVNKICQEFPLIVDKINAPNLDVIRQSLATKLIEKENNLSVIEQLIKDNILDEETGKIRKYKINLEISNLKQNINQLPPDNLSVIASTISNPQFWYDLSAIESRFYLREFIKVIEIIPDNNNPKKWQLNLQFIFDSLLKH